jgi:hypothetical protein
MITRTTDFLKQADTNHNGTIDSDEAADPNAKGMLDRIFQRMGKEPHYPVAISEIAQGYESFLKSRGGGGSPSAGGLAPPGSSSTPSSPAASSTPGTMTWTSPPGIGFGSTSSGGISSGKSPGPTQLASIGGAAFGGPPGSAKGSGASADAKSAPRRPSHILTIRERLPDGLPGWFLVRNHDGQVAMADYASSWTPESLARFDSYDLNHDGIITAEECLKVEKQENASRGEASGE